RPRICEERALEARPLLKGHVHDEIDVHAFEGLECATDSGKSLRSIMRAVQVPQNGVVEGLCPDADRGEADLLEFAQARRRRMQWKDFDGTLACDRDLFKHVREVARVERGCPTAHVQGCEWSGVVHLDLCVQRSEVVR